MVSPTARSVVMELIVFVGVVLFYFAMQLWILPRMGINT